MSDSDGILARRFVADHPAQAARVLERLPGAGAAVLASVEPRTAARALESMSPSRAAAALEALAPPAASAVIAASDRDVAAALLRRLDAETRARVLDAIAEPHAEGLRVLLRYPEGSAGAVMDPTVLSVPSDLMVEEALARIRDEPGQTIYYVYATDRAGRLDGVINLRELMLAAAHVPLTSVLRRPVARVHVSAGRQAIVDHPGWLQFHALPVTDDDERLLGVLRYETLRWLERVDDRAVTKTTSAMVTLSELYWIGLTGLIEGLSSTVARGIAAEADTERDVP